MRFWPPSDDRWKAALHWGLITIFDVCLVGVAVLEGNSWVLPRPDSLLGGLLPSGCGTTIFVVSYRAMSTAETTGQTAGELYTDGLYARPRTPQYVGMIIGVIGFTFLVNALSVAVLCLLHICWLVLLPFAEESLLRAQFGDEYDAYCDHVPRFVSRRTIRGP